MNGPELLTLHVDQLLGQFVVGRVVFVVELGIGRVVHLGRRNDESGAYCSLQMVLLMVLIDVSIGNGTGRKKQTNGSVSKGQQEMVQIFDTRRRGDGGIYQ